MCTTGAGTQNRIVELPNFVSPPSRSPFCLDSIRKRNSYCDALRASFTSKMSPSASVVKVFIVGKSFFKAAVSLNDITDEGDFVAAIRREFDLTASEAVRLQLRVVSSEPDKDNATTLFDDAPEDAAVINSATLPKPGAWVVGKVVALPAAEGAGSGAGDSATLRAGEFEAT